MIRLDAMALRALGGMATTAPTAPRPRPDLLEWGAIRDGCLRRARAWRVPPRWSARDWFEEIHVLATSAAWRASKDFDPTRGVPFDAFVRLRVLASLRTRHRQEWAYAIHFGTEPVAESVARPSDESLLLAETQELLRSALARLSETDRWLIEHLFWHGCTEAEAASGLGITQQAVSKRKRLILIALRPWIEICDEN